MVQPEGPVEATIGRRHIEGSVPINRCEGGPTSSRTTLLCRVAHLLLESRICGHAAIKAMRKGITDPVLGRD
jgi:hypothetical protein